MAPDVSVGDASHVGSQRLHSVTGVASNRSLDSSLFGRLAELAEYIDSDTVHETVDRCPSKVQ